jgi:hypothetical protein
LFAIYLKILRAFQNIERFVHIRIFKLIYFVHFFRKIYDAHDAQTTPNMD